MLRVVPVQTDVQQLLASSLPELNDIQAVQAQTGYTNEVDIYVRGDVATGPIDARTGSPVNVEWQCSAAALIRTDHPDMVGQATSIGDFVIASSSGSSRGSAAPCVPGFGDGSCRAIAVTVPIAVPVRVRLAGAHGCPRRPRRAGTPPAPLSASPRRP